MCGIVGIWNNVKATEYARDALFHLQHRGQESAGIASSDGETIKHKAYMGKVAETLTNSRIKSLTGDCAIGQNRYSTTGSSDIRNAQPLVVQTRFGPIAMVHNGNLVNQNKLREILATQGVVFTTTSDTELICHFIARSSKKSLIGATIEALSTVKGAYSLLLMSNEELIMARDPKGFRPLVLAGFSDGSTIVASETSAIESIAIQKGLTLLEDIKEVEPGQLYRLERANPTLYHTDHLERINREPRPCVFELNYLSRPDSIVFGRHVGSIREQLGEKLAREHGNPNEAIVMPVPDSGTPAAIGYARASGLKLELQGFIRSHYADRTFIQPSQTDRDSGVYKKLSVDKVRVSGQNVVLVDDSIVRGTTMPKLIDMLKKAGAISVHVRIAAPPNRHPCFYGIDMPNKTNLIASNRTVDTVCQLIGADSLGYLSLEGLHDVVLKNGPSEKIKDPYTNICDACFSGQYPQL